MSSSLEGLRARFHAFAGREARVSFAPGRINVIGEHTDYTDGFVLPASLALGTWVAAAPREDGSVRVLSETEGDVASFPLDIEPRSARSNWSDYVAGVAWSLQRSGRMLGGADLLVMSNVPMGAGLSSSAALEVACAYALLDAAGIEMTPLEVARACQTAENVFVGARCGIMDQFVATHGRRDRAVLLDCASFTFGLVPLLEDHGFLAANTMVRHALADGEYNLRRAECEEILHAAAKKLPHRARLAELTEREAEQLSRELPPTAARRLRHVTSENRRVHAAARALERGDARHLGELLGASHASLRDDYEVSCAELDCMVDLAQKLPGVAGARMMGGGFGGSVLVLVHSPALDAARSALRAAYAAATGIDPAIHVCELGDGGGTLG